MYANAIQAPANKKGDPVGSPLFGADDCLLTAGLRFLNTPNIHLKKYNVNCKNGPQQDHALRDMFGGHFRSKIAGQQQQVAVRTSTMTKWGIGLSLAT